MKESLQEHYAKKSICFGCGPANKMGLRIRSFVEGERVIADWTPEKHHEAFPNVLNGGIIGALLDCHSNWTAAWQIMNNRQEKSPPCTVTAEYSIKLKRPTPTEGAKPIHLEAWVLESDQKKAKIAAELSVNSEICATCEGLFVAVNPGHPAYHRW
ncbi:MAG: PaaI family thioesterase [Bradymonadales bacterium]|nr:MAG: PaaI family thioesterase [Bradymonadales bacterium]